MTIDELQSQAATFEKNYKTLKEKIESEVVEWKWSKKQYYSAEPFFNEKNRRGKQAKLLKSAPKDPAGNVQCGFNAVGQVIIEKEIQKFPDHGWDRFFMYEENIIWELAFTKKGEMTYLRRCEIENGLTKKCEHLHLVIGGKQHRTEAYNYNNSNQLVSSVMHNVYFDRAGMSSLYQYRYEYNENELQAIIADIDHTYDPKPIRNLFVYKAK